MGKWTRVIGRTLETVGEWEGENGENWEDGEDGESSWGGGGE